MREDTTGGSVPSLYDTRDGIDAVAATSRRRGRPRKNVVVVPDFPVPDGSGLDDTLKVIEQLRADLRVQYDVNAIRLAMSLSSRADRCYHLCDCVEKACALACRWKTTGEDAGLMVFDGRIWIPCRDIIFIKAVKQSLMDIGVAQGDLSYFEGKILKAAMTGAQLSPLQVNKFLVGFSNGVWDFTDIYHPISRPFSDRCEITSILSYPYIPDAQCPKWKAFLNEMLDKKQVEMLQRFLGLGIYPRTLLPYKVENSLWLIGPGGNGKSVICEVVTGVYGRENIGNISLMGLIKGGDESAWNLAHIEGKTFNYCTEIKAEDITRYSDQFKSLCSGEPQMARRLRENVHTMTEVPYLIFNMNQKPRFDNQDFASERRLLYVVFRRAVRKEDMNPHLAAELAEEYSGIRNWMMEGFMKLVQENYKMTATEMSVQESDDYLLENGQSVAYYLKKRKMRAYMYTGETFRNCHKVIVSRLYEDYVKWMEADGIEPVSIVKFGKDLSRLQFRKTRHGQLGQIYDLWSEDSIEFELKNY